MVSLYAVWVPTLCAAHIVGFLLLLYSLEQVSIERYSTNSQSISSPIVKLKSVMRIKVAQVDDFLSINEV